MVVLGIDPGTQFVGRAVIAKTANGWEALEHGVWSLSAKSSIENKLSELSSYLQNLYKNFKAEVMVVERAFFARNAESAFKIGLARGVCMAEAGRHGSVVREYAARAVKKGICGQGDADKNTVALFVGQHLKIKNFDRSDESDALALALYGAWEWEKELALRARGIEL